MKKLTREEFNDICCLSAEEVVTRLLDEGIALSEVNDKDRAIALFASELEKRIFEEEME